MFFHTVIILKREVIYFVCSSDNYCGTIYNREDHQDHIARRIHYNNAYPTDHNTCLWDRVRDGWSNSSPISFHRGNGCWELSNYKLAETLEILAPALITKPNFTPAEENAELQILKSQDMHMNLYLININMIHVCEPIQAEFAPKQPFI